MNLQTQHLQNKRVPICIGTGLVALDVIISSDKHIPAKFLAGGSCGNVLTILSYLGWKSYPIARLSNNVAGAVLLEDLQKWKVNDELLTFTSDGSTPVIIHRILRNNDGSPKHKFEFRNPENGSYLPSYKACLSKDVPSLIEKVASCDLFFFDRMNRAAIDLAKKHKENNATIFFEPSSSKEERPFRESIAVADIVKFSSDRITNYDEFYPDAVAQLEIQTLGAEGLKFRTKGQCKWTLLSSFNIENTIDSAGAGDWCTAGLLNILKDLPKSEWTSERITYALQFGQVLSALNCTFEGARGLMYHISKTDLILTACHIIDTQLKKIPTRVRPEPITENNDASRDISSLLLTI